MSWLSACESRLADPAPGMICISTAGSNDNFVAPVRNLSVAGEADWRVPRELSEIDDGAALLAFYRRYRSLHLYDGYVHETQLPIAQGVVLYDPADWQKHTASTVAEWDSYLTADDVLPYAKEDFIAIGHPGGAWNTIHLVVRGIAKGRVFWWDWDGPPTTKQDCLAVSFATFLHFLFTTDPVVLLNTIFGSPSVYFDGHTDQQWIPHKYVPDRSVLNTDENGMLLSDTPGPPV